MNTYHYKHFSLWERQKLESLIGNKPILEPIYGQTNHGWAIKDWKWLISINLLVSILKRSRKTIKRELLNEDMKHLLMILVKTLVLFHIHQQLHKLIELTNTWIEINKQSKYLSLIN
jgi:hypothetical protein